MKKVLKRIFLAIIAVEIAAILLVVFQPRLIPNAFASSSPKKAIVRKAQQCREFVTHAWKLNDSVRHYLEQSYLNGIGVVKFYRDIQPKLDSGKLVLIENNQFYITDTMRYSYPFLTPKGSSLLEKLGEKFKAKLKNTDLKETRFVVTSMFRTVSSVSRLRRHNRNAIRHSAHLHGTTFDVSYDEFDHPRPLSPDEKAYLKEMLAQSIYELREEKRCWATYELWQTCFHVVSR